jgi:hypothetical protein
MKKPRLLEESQQTRRREKEEGRGRRVCRVEREGSKSELDIP